MADLLSRDNNNEWKKHIIHAMLREIKNFIYFSITLTLKLSWVWIVSSSSQRAKKSHHFGQDNSLF
jgi:hypothetical protein